MWPMSRRAPGGGRTPCSWARRCPRPPIRNERCARLRVCRGAGVRVEVKVCGLTRASDARAAAALGARYIGVIFAGGPRSLDPDAAREVLDGGGATVRRVGVFGKTDARTIAAAVEMAGLDIVQLHADPTSDEVRAV